MDRNTRDKNDLRPLISSIVEALLTSPLQEDDDMFQLPVLLSCTILKLMHTDRSMLKRALGNPENASKVKRVIAPVLGSRPQRRDGEVSDVRITSCCNVAKYSLPAFVLNDHPREYRSVQT
jgi:hypothetical protein